MQRFLQRFLFAGIIAILGTINLSAQGVTTSRMSGTISDTNGESLFGVTVTAKHEPSGSLYGAVTREDGRFNIIGLRVGGPYTVSISYTGFNPIIKENIFLSLGQEYSLREKMGEDATVIGEVVVEGIRTILGTDKNGAGTDISEQQINALPTVARNLTDFTRLTPQANIQGDNSISIAGANNRFNSIYIDGAVNNDVFGLAASGTNGGQVGISPLSPDAIEQFNVVVSPYDVKLSGFTGGGINAVTRGGSNKVEGSAYFLTRNQKLAGFRPTVDEALPKDDRRLDDFTAQTYGVRFGAPIKKDKAFIFLNVELQNDETPLPFDFSTYNGNSTEAEIAAFGAKLKTLGYDAGGFLGKTSTLEGRKILGRLDFNLNRNNKLMVRHHYTYGKSVYGNGSNGNSINFENTGITFPSTTNSSAVELNTVIGSTYSNNLIIGYTNVNDDRDPTASPFPNIEIQDGSGRIYAGSEAFSGANALTQNIVTLTNNFNIYKGNQQITIGTHNEFFDIYNLFIRRPYGYYRYKSLNDFMTDGLPDRYRRSYSLIDDVSEDGSKAAAEFQSLQLGFYVQDEVQFTNRFSGSFGFRFDVPFFLDKPAAATTFNDEVAAQLSAAGYDLQGAKAGSPPSAQVLFSPRMGFNWNAMGDRDLVVRGGIGVFTSRVPFVWPGGMYTNNGLLLADVDVNASKIASTSNFAFQPDINRQYNLQDFGLSAGSSQLDLFSKDFRYPQSLRTSLAIDKKLPWGVLATLEGIYSKTINNVTYQNINLKPATGTLSGGPDNRAIYPGGRISGSYTDIILGSNTSKGYNYNLTAQLQKPFKNGFVGSVSYTYGEAKALNDLTSSQNSSNWQFVENINGQNNPTLGYSDFDLGSRIAGFLSKRFQYGKNSGGATTLSLFYNGQSGQRYSYTYNGNLNNSGFDNFQNLIYIPATASDIRLIDDANLGTASEQWNALNAFIEGDDYLKNNRGGFSERNGARSPFTNIFDFKVIQEFFVGIGGTPRSVQVSLDIFNIGNLIKSSYGRRYFVGFDSYSLINYKGNDANGNPTYTFKTPNTGNDVWSIDESGINSSIWQGQLGLRINF